MLSLDRFLCNNQTKHSLTLYLGNHVMTHFRDCQKVIVVSTQQGAMSNQGNVDHLSTMEDEIDTVIFLHALAIARTGEVILHIMSQDTDVFVLTLRYMPELGQHTCIIRGVGENRHTVPLLPICNALGSEVTAALPCFHCFTGCDTTGQFSGKGKQWCWKVLKTLSRATVRAFIDLGKTAISSQETSKAQEELSLDYTAQEQRPKKLGNKMAAFQKISS